MSATDLISKLTARPYARDVDTAPVYWMLGIGWRLLATGVQTGGSICLVDQLVPAGTVLNTQVHPQEEGLYVASGRCTVRAGGETSEAKAGTFVNVPRHNQHSLTFEEDTRLLSFYLPAGFDTWLMAGAVPAERNEPQPPGSPQPPDALIERLSDDYLGGMPDPTETTTRVNPVATPPTLANVETSELFRYDGASWAVLADRAATGGSYCGFEVVMPEGRAEAPHLHDDSDEVICVLEGEIEIWLEGDRHRVGGEGMAFVPRGTLHTYRATSSQVRLLDVHSKPGFERILARLGEPADRFAIADQKTDPSPAFAERRANLFEEIGLRQVPLDPG